MRACKCPLSLEREQDNRATLFENQPPSPHPTPLSVLLPRNHTTNCCLAPVLLTSFSQASKLNVAGRRYGRFLCVSFLNSGIRAKQLQRKFMGSSVSVSYGAYNGETMFCDFLSLQYVHSINHHLCVHATILRRSSLGKRRNFGFLNL